MKRYSAKLTLDVQPAKTEKAWMITVSGKVHWIPYTFVKEYNPATKEIQIDVFILDQKGIKYRI